MKNFTHVFVRVILTFISLIFQCNMYYIFSWQFPHCLNLDVSCLLNGSPCSPVFDGPSVSLQQHKGVLLQQSLSSLKTKQKRGVGGTDVGGGLLTALTAVRDVGLSKQEMT